MPLDPLLQQAYDQGRPLAQKPFRAACYAPFVSLLFDSLGNVRACCKNFTYLLGNLRQQRLRDIWQGPAVAQMREAMRNYDLSAGCDHCYWQITSAHAASAFSRLFDNYRVASDPRQARPALMEFSITNTCNLACVMCNGEYSSTIRARRDRLPPLPRFYHDTFFDDLGEFLPDLEYAKFSGGEPFLAAESYRIWDRMIADGLTPPCHAITNATVRTPQMQRVLEAIPFDLTVSLDSIHRATHEAIRVGIDHDQVMANLRWLLDYVRQAGRHLELSHCLLRQNWREFGEFLQFADALDVNAYVCTVVYPASCSLYTLPAGELRQVVATLERQESSMLAALTRNREAWSNTLAQLREHAQNASSQRPGFVAMRILEPFGPAGELPTTLHAPPQVDAAAKTEDPVESARSTLAAWSLNGRVAGFASDEADQVIRLIEQPDDFLGIEAGRAVGRRIDAVIAQFRLIYGGGTAIEIFEDSPQRADRVLSFYVPGGTVTQIRLITLPGNQHAAHALTLAALRRGDLAKNPG